MFTLHHSGETQPEYEVLAGVDILDGLYGVLLDQTIRFTCKRNFNNYPSELRRIVYYAADLGRSFVYYINDFYLAAKDISLLYRYRWHVELTLNRSNSISASKSFGESLKMRDSYRSMSQSSPTASSQSLNTTSSWRCLSSRICASLETPCWSRTICVNSLGNGKMTRRMTGNWRLIFSF